MILNEHTDAGMIIKSEHLLGAYYILNTQRSTLHALSYFSLTTSLVRFRLSYRKLPICDVFSLENRSRRWEAARS